MPSPSLLSLSLPPSSRRRDRLSLSRRMRDWLRLNGKTQGWLAAKVGVTGGQLSLIVNGHRVPSLPVATKIETITGGFIRATDFAPDGDE